MRGTRREQLRMRPLDAAGFDAGHREVVDTAGMAATATLEAVVVDEREGVRGAVDLGVEGDEGSGRLVPIVAL